MLFETMCQTVKYAVLPFASNHTVDNELLRLHQTLLFSINTYEKLIAFKMSY